MRHWPLLIGGMFAWSLVAKPVWAALPPAPKLPPASPSVQPSAPPVAASPATESLPTELEPPPASDSLDADVPGLESLPEATDSMPASGSMNPEKSVKIKANSLENDRQGGIARAHGNVTLTFKDMVITTDELSYDSKAKRAWTDKPFKLVQLKDGKATQTITGKRLDYRLGEQVAEVSDAILEMPAKTAGHMIHISAKKLKSINRTKFVIEDGTFTTCSLLEEERIPHYHVAAKSMEYIPEVSLSGWHTTMHINNRPVMYLPFYWIPLSRPDNNNFEVGQNDIEGRFLKTRYGYNLNPYHSGTLFNYFMENKKYGVGFDHLWKADPNSQTAVSFYGLPLPDTDDMDPENPYTDNWAKYGLTGTPFQDHMFHFYHQQNLLGMRFNVKYEDMNMYSFTNLPKNVAGGVDRRKEFAPQLREVYNSHDLGVTGNFSGTNFALNRTFREAKSSGNVSTNHTGRFGTQLGALRIDGNSNWNESKQWLSPIDTAFGKTNSNPQSNWTNNLTFNHNWAGGPNTTLTLNHWRRDYPGLTLDEQLDPTLTMRQSFGWGNATLNVQKRVDLSPNSQRPEVIRSRSYINKEPELILESNSLLTDYQPFRVTMGLGRYFESANYNPSDPMLAYALNPINRFNPELTLINKQHDIKVGKLDFGGTGLRQFFYSTGDSQYAVNFNSSLTSEFGDHLGTTFSYAKSMTDPNNNTPFKFDNLGLAKNTTLNGTVVVKGTKDESGNIPLNWTTTSGYDYERQRYMNMNTTLNYNPNKRVTLQMQTGYDFEDIPNLSLKNGAWSPLGMTFNVRSRDGDFGNVFGLDQLTPGWEFNNTLSYDFMKGQWGSLQNSFRVALGDRWQNHWEFKITGAYDYGGVVNFIPTEQGYHLNEISLSRDLHDYILTLAYNRQAQTYMLRLTMTAFGTDLINFNQSGFSAGGVDLKNLSNPSSLIPGM